MMTNSLLEIWNLVWTKRQTGQANRKGFAIYIIVPGAQQIFAFFFGPVLLRDFVQSIFSALFDEFIV